MKIENDKYYTPVALANYCWDRTMKLIGENNVTEIVEPSCGDGAFYHHEKYRPDFGYDIEPQCDFAGVSKADFLEVDIAYRKGRLIIGNPPFGRCLSLAQRFYKKSIDIADYVAFILPISQLDNTSSLYEFDLIHSEDLGKRSYTGRDLHCCFNIYRRPVIGWPNEKQVSKLEDITIYRQDCTGYEDKDFDVRMCHWGDGTAGKILRDGEHYSAEYKIKVNNAEKRDEIVRVLKSFDWKGYLNCIAMRKLYQFQIIDVLKNNVKGIK